MKTVEELMKEMTLEEKAGMCSGHDFWHLKGVERLQIPRVMVCDGPHGLRKQDESADHLGINDSIEAVCFPSAAGLAASFDRGLLEHVGEVLGEECQAENISVLLGPAINIKRSPLCGRNFEYMSEDPYLAGELAAAYIQGVQSKNVGTSLKHFAANNQEKRRSTVSAQMDERTLREIYLTGFETAVKKGKPWTVMCSYNRINGEYVSQSHRLLTDILRREWGFHGVLVTDWSACDQRVKGLVAGQDLEMPDSGGVNDKLIVEAVKKGILDEKVLDQAVMRILNLICRYVDGVDEKAVFNRRIHHEEARKAACQSMVLLKNQAEEGREKVLPLKKGGRYAFIGPFAKAPRYQGGGSSHINPSFVSNAFDQCSCYGEICYAKGYEDKEEENSKNGQEKELIQEAVQLARQCDGAVVFAGLSEVMESEAYDREHMKLPDCQNTLIKAVLESQPNTVVVLHNGSPVEMPWIQEAPAVLESYLAGEAVGEAQAALLFGEENPCGKLAETFPVRVQDNPAWLDFGGQKDVVCYGEGVYVGYRYYDKKEMDVLFPFGHGLSYTQYSYSGLVLDKKVLKGEETLAVEFKVKNMGDYTGKEAAQVYVHKIGSEISRPLKELKGFETAELCPGEEKTIRVTLDRRSFSHFDEEKNDWRVEPGDYEVLIGASSRDIRLKGMVTYLENSSENWRCHRNTTLGDIKRNPAAYEAYKKMLKEELGRLPFENLSSTDALGEGMGKMAEAMLQDSPLRSLRSFFKGRIDDSFLERMVDTINKAVDNK